MSRISQKNYEEWKRLVLDNLFYFDKWILGYDAAVRPEKVGMEIATHLDMCRFIEGKHIEENESEIRPFKLCEMPRGSLKSSAITVGYPIQQILKNPNIRILITNEIYKNTIKFLDEIKGHFETNQILQEIYGDYVGKSCWKVEEITVSKRNIVLKEPTISLGSLDVLKVGMHYDLIIIDDWVSENNVMNADQIANTIKKYKLALSLLQPDGQIIVIGTRWHFNDLYSYIESYEQHRFNVYKRGAYNPDGSLLFPEKLNEKFLNDQRISQGSYVFSCQYLNDPVDDESAHFKKDWIRFYEIDKAGFFRPITDDHTEITTSIAKDKKYYSLDEMNLSLTVDPSSGQSVDYTGVTLCAIDPENRVYVLEAYHKKLRPPEIVDLIFEYHKRYPNLTIGIEAAAMQIILKYNLHEKMAKEEDYFYIKTFDTTYTKSKEARIKSLTYRFEFATIFLKPDQQDLIDEILRFPRSTVDDILDALAYQPEVLSVPTQANEATLKAGTWAWYMAERDRDKSDKLFIGSHKDMTENYYNESN